MEASCIPSVWEAIANEDSLKLGAMLPVAPLLIVAVFAA